MRRFCNHYVQLSPSTLLLSIAILLVATAHGALAAPPGRELSSDERTAVAVVIKTLDGKSLTEWSTLLQSILNKGKIRTALPDDIYMNAEEKANDTPYAYTLPDEFAKHEAKSWPEPIAIVLAPRFFDASPVSRAALLVHEAGHWKAFVTKGRSDEYDGYKTEYDCAEKLGLTETDGLPYFCMLDGVVEYVVPRNPEYKTYHDVKAYMANDH